MVRTLRRGWRVHILAIMVYLILALILTWPLAAHFGTHVPGNGIDDPPLTWNLWWVPHALLTHRANPFDGTSIFYPLGINLAFYTLTILNGLLSVPLQALFGLVPASNVLLIASLVLSGYGAFLLMRQILAGREAGRLGDGPHPIVQSSYLPVLLAALTSGIIYAFASSKLFYAALGQWNIASSQWIPFYALCLVKIERQPDRWRYPILAALFLLFQAYAEMTYASFLVLFTALWLVWPRERRRWLALLRPAAISGLLFAAGIAPVLAAMIPDMLAEGSVLSEGGGFADVFSADLLGFLVPTMLHPVLGTIVERFDFDHTVGQHLYPGYAVLALASLAVLAWVSAGRRRRQDPGATQGPGESSEVGGAYTIPFWVASTLIFWLLTLGPRLRVNGQDTGLPLPFALVARLPFFEGNRYPSRYSVMLMLSLAVLAGWGLVALWRWAGRSRPAPLRLAPLLLVAALLFEHLSMPLPLSDMRVPDVYQAIAELPGEMTLLDVPVGWRNGARVTGALDEIIMFQEYYQAAHGKNLLGGNTSRNPPLKFQYFTEAPVLNTLIALETGHAVDEATIEQDRLLAAQVLRFLNVGAVVIHLDHAGAEVRSYLESVLPLDRLEGSDDPSRPAYVTRLPPWPASWQARADDPVGRLSYGEGWGALDGEIAWAQRRAVRLLVPGDGQDRHMRFRAFAPGDGQRLRVTINGTPAGEVAMSPGWQDLELELPSALHAGLNDVRLRFDRLYPASVTGPSPRVAGTTGVSVPANVVVISAGEETGDFGHIYVNGQDVSPNKRGYNVAAIDPETGDVEQVASFDTHLDEEASRELAAWLEQVPDGHIVAVAAADEASRLLGAQAVAALRGIGATGDLRDKFRWSHAIIGVKGAAPGTAAEALSAIRPVRVVAGEPVTEPQVAAAFGPITFER